MGLRSPEATDALISAIVLRYHGIEYERALDGRGAHLPVSPTQFSLGVTRSLDGLIEYASGRDREILEEVRDDPVTYKELFRMSPDLLQRQHVAVMGGEQRRFYMGSYEHPDNVDWLSYCALISQDSNLESHSRTTVVKALKSLSTNLITYFGKLKLTGMMNHAFGKGGKTSPVQVLHAFDRAYMKATGDSRSLFDLSVGEEQGGHLHDWDYMHNYWNDDSNTERAVSHILTENLPTLLSNNREDILETLSGLSDLYNKFSDWGLISGIQQSNYYKREGSYVMGILKAFDKVYQTRTKDGSLFDQKQPTSLSEEPFRKTGPNSKYISPIVINRIFHPTQTTNGVSLTIQQASEELRAAAATGASLYLADILRVAGRTGETPQLVAEVRDNFPWLTWQQFVEQAGFDYADYLPSFEVRKSGVNGTNGHTNRKTVRGLAEDSIEIKLISEHNVLTVPIGEGKETPEVLEKLLADDYELVRFKQKPRNRVEKTDDMSSFKYLKALMCSRPLLTREEETTVLTEMKHYELKARQAAQTNDVNVYESYKRRWEQVREYFIESNMRLVVGKAGRVANSEYIFQELIQEASQGLMRASELFAYWEGNKFSTYATYWVNQKILRYFYDKTKVIRVSEEVTKRRRKIDKELAEQTNLTIEQLAEKLELSPEQVQRALDMPKEPKSLYAPTGDDESWILLGKIQDTKQHTGEQLSEPMEALRVMEDTLEACTVLPSDHPHALTYREEHILRQRLTLEKEGGQGIGSGFYHKTFAALGEELGITGERVKQILRRVKPKFEAALQERGLVPVEENQEQPTAEVIELPQQGDLELQNVVSF